MSSTKWAVLVAAGLTCGGVHAQVFDLQVGRSADLSKEAQISAEAGLVIGDIDYYGTRANFRVAERLLVGADLGIADDSYNNVTALGAFGMYQLDLDLPVSVAVRASYDVGLDSDVTFSDLGADVIASAPIPQQPNLSAYGTAGLHRGAEDFKHEARFARDDDELFFMLGAGAVYQINATASAYAELDIISGDYYDDTVLGAGIRLSFL